MLPAKSPDVKKTQLINWNWNVPGCW